MVLRTAPPRHTTSPLPAQTRPDRPRRDDAVHYMYATAGCRAADPTDSHVQARCRSREYPNLQAEALAAMLSPGSAPTRGLSPDSGHAPRDI